MKYEKSFHVLPSLNVVLGAGWKAAHAFGAVDPHLDKLVFALSL
jgi:hypothetical protein